MEVARYISLVHGPDDDAIRNNRTVHYCGTFEETVLVTVSMYTERSLPLLTSRNGKANKLIRNVRREECQCDVSWECGNGPTVGFHQGIHAK